MTWPGTMLYSSSQFADFSWTGLLSGLFTWNWWRKDCSPKLRTGLSVTNHPISLPPCRGVLLLMAALACGYDPHWPLWHKMCEGNESLVSYIRAAVIGSQRSLVPLNYPLTQPGLLGPSGVPCPLHPLLIGGCPLEHLSHTKLLAAGVSGCISASAWPTGIWTKYWPLHWTRWPFNWVDFSLDERMNGREYKCFWAPELDWYHRRMRKWNGLGWI